MKARNIAAVVLASAVGIAMLYLGFSSRPPAPEKTFTTAELPPPWKPDVLEAVELMPLADSDGRVKSVHTFAHYELLRTRAYASLSLKVEDAKKKRSWTPTAWLLDCLFFPKEANRYPVFAVEDGEVLAQLGLAPHAKQRDRYTFNELLPGREAIIAAARRLSARKTEDMTRIERLTNTLARNFMEYESLVGALDAGRETVRIPDDVADESLKPWAAKDIPAIKALALVAESPTWKSLGEQRKSGAPVTVPPWLERLLPEIDSKMRTAGVLRWYPPSDKNANNWETPVGIIRDLAEGGPHAVTASAKLHELSELATLAADRSQNDAFQEKLKAFANARTAEAKAAGAYGKVAHDRTYLKWRVFEFAKWGFITLFLLTAISWLKPGAKRFQTFIKVCAWAGFAAIAAGIGQRVWITGWGPVTNIYETIPYITLMAGIFALLMGKAMKNVIPLSVAVAVGAMGMFLASRYESGQSADTIDALVAVLRSNYWLWTHVTSINLGYATVLLAAIFSMVYIFARVFDVMRREGNLFRDLTRCAYGILCFGLFFALIGTVLGGIWGNDSWGRFWGWDPKENGALLIVLWCLMVMHMRLAGWVREFGFHLWTAAGAIPCIFSWWHVNLLNVGLHSYGFTEGLEDKLFWAYGIVGGIILLGVGLRVMEAVARRQMAEESVVTGGRADAA
jgi:ABC-type transport system involved in cytochrome c biogenesis permease subunit